MKGRKKNEVLNKYAGTVEEPIRTSQSLILAVILEPGPYRRQRKPGLTRAAGIASHGASRGSSCRLPATPPAVACNLK